MGLSSYKNYTKIPKKKNIITINIIYKNQNIYILVFIIGLIDLILFFSFFYKENLI